MTEDVKYILHLVAQALFDKQGMNILALDVRGLSTLTDYMIIAEGHVDKHVVALADHVISTLEKTVHLSPLHVEGEAAGDWIVIDYLDVMVHIFMPGLREQYALEQLWPEAKIVDVPIHVISK